VEGLERTAKTTGKTTFSASDRAECRANPPDLPSIAAELRSLLTPDQRRELAGLLLAGEAVSR
jgi:hypothetical protein